MSPQHFPRHRSGPRAGVLLGADPAPLGSGVGTGTLGPDALRGQLAGLSLSGAPVRELRAVVGRLTELEGQRLSIVAPSRRSRPR